MTSDAFNVYSGCKNLRGTIKIGSPIETSVLGFFENAATAPGAGLKIVYDKNKPAIVKTAKNLWKTKSAKSKITQAPY